MPLGGRRGDQPAALIVLALMPVTPRYRSNRFAFNLGRLVTLAVVGATMPAMGACMTGPIIVSGHVRALADGTLPERP